MKKQKIREYTINGNISGEKYIELLNWLLNTAKADEFSFAFNEEVGIHENGIQLEKELKPYLIRKRKTDIWLTAERRKNEIVGGVYYYKYNQITRKILSIFSHSLFGWGDDNLEELPKDIIFYKDRKAILEVIGHSHFLTTYFLNDETFLEWHKKFFEKDELWYRN